jgi:hypothetical protein
MTRTGTFLWGFLTGSVIVSVFLYFFFIRRSNEYVEVKSDYLIENGGIVKNGTLLKIDKPMSEGFTRYILYLNLQDGELLDKHLEDESDVVIPYWLSSDTLKTE